MRMPGALRSIAFLAVAASITVATESLGRLQPGALRAGQLPPSQAPSRDSSPTPRPTGIVRGRVLDAGTGSPLRRARVSLAVPRGGQPRSTRTDLEGRYEFTELPASRYIVTASKVPYVTLQIGQRSPFEEGRPIELGEGQAIERLDLALPRGCVIAGSVIDDLGEPAASLQVLALRQQYFEGRRQLVPVGRPAQTNDIGQYRLYGLPPGTYYVRTQATTWDSTSPLDEGVSFAATYYPSSAGAAQAQPVTVRVGQERTGVDVSLVLARMARLSGTASDSRGRALVGQSVMLLQVARGPSSVTTSGNASALVQPDGTFSMTHVPPGEYVLTARSAGSQIGARESAWLPVTVTGADLAGLMLMTAPAIVITGQVEFEGQTTPPSSPGTVRVQALEVGSRRGQGPVETRVREDWSFELGGITAGTRVLRLAGLPAGWSLKAVHAGDVDVTDRALEVRSTRDIAGVRVIITNRVTELTGAVSDESGQPVKDYTLVVFAEGAARWTEHSRFLAVARPDQLGQYSVTGLPPGEYLAVALDYVEEGQASDPEFLEGLRRHATAFSLAEGERRALNLEIVKGNTRE